MFHFALDVFCMYITPYDRLVNIPQCRFGSGRWVCRTAMKQLPMNSVSSIIGACPPHGVLKLWGSEVKSDRPQMACMVELAAGTESPYIETHGRPPFYGG